MATLRQCDNCDNQIKLDDDFDGQWIRCPRCKEVVQVRGQWQQEYAGNHRREQWLDPRRKRKSGFFALWIGLGVGCGALMLIAVAIVVFAGRKTAERPDLDGDLPVDGIRARAPLPELSAARTIQPGVLFQETILQPGPLPMKVWFYRPERANGKLPLVLVPPAGSTLFAGMDLGDGDRAEHYPYVRAGFAVGSFEIDGHVPDGPGASDEDILQGARAFRDAKAGLNNAKAALDYFLAKSPDVDPNRVFIAGHSSAATLALLVAEHEPRIKGCVAYCGVSDVEARVAPAIAALDRALPGYREFLRFSSPKTHVEKLMCPVFLFHAQDDDNVPVAQTTNFAKLLKKTNADVTLDTSARGGHYESMINTGIPKGIDWMRKR